MRSLPFALALVVLATVLAPTAAAHIPPPPDTMCADPAVPCAIGYASAFALWASTTVGHEACHIFGC